MEENNWNAIDRWIVGESWIGSQFEEHLTELCVNIGERWSSSEGERRAGEYIRGRYDSFGLADARLDDVPLDTWEFSSAEGSIAESGQEIDVLPFHFCPPFEIEAAVVDAGYGQMHELVILGESLRGAAAVVNLGQESFTPPKPLSDRLNALAERGAAAAIVVETKSGRRMEYHNGTDWRDDQPSTLPLPAVTTSREHGAELRRLAGNATLRVKVESRLFKDKGINTVADLPGEKWPEEMLVLGAHHDTVNGTPGGNDNASGICVVLETARVLGALKEELGISPGCNIRFTTWSAEEQGFQGSMAFVDKYWPLDSGALLPRLAINLDELAAGTIKGLVLAFPHLRNFIQTKINELGDGYKCHVMSQLDVSSDHFPFFKRGIDAAHCWRWRFHGRHPDSDFHHEA
ncbi:MAG: M28 family peptidase, partial [Planctomycetota bacterium]|nr:M28 family peptidase [Planctomycetota bacterium]